MLLSAPLSASKIDLVSKRRPFRSLALHSATAAHAAAATAAAPFLLRRRRWGWRIGLADVFIGDVAIMLFVEACEKRIRKLDKLLLRHAAFAGLVEIVETRRREHRARFLDNFEILGLDETAVMNVREAIHTRDIGAPLLAGVDAALAAPFRRGGEDLILTVCIGALLGKAGGGPAGYRQRGDKSGGVKTHGILPRERHSTATPTGSRDHAGVWR